MTEVTHTDEHLLNVYEAVIDLPFVVEVSDGDTLDRLSFWNTEPCGFENADIARGEMYGRLALEVVKRFDMPLLLTMILWDMVAAGKRTGLEAGFIGVVVTTSKAGALN